MGRRSGGTKVLFFIKLSSAATADMRKDRNIMIFRVRSLLSLNPMIGGLPRTSGNCWRLRAAQQIFSVEERLLLTRIAEVSLGRRGPTHPLAQDGPRVSLGNSRLPSANLIPARNVGRHVRPSDWIRCFCEGRAKHDETSRRTLRAGRD